MNQLSLLDYTPTDAERTDTPPPARRGNRHAAAHFHKRASVLLAIANRMIASNRLPREVLKHEVSRALKLRELALEEARCHE